MAAASVATPRLHLIFYRHHRIAATLRPFSTIKHHRLPVIFNRNKQRSFSTSSENETPRAGRSGSISSPPVQTVDYVQKIDVNPPKGTRDFPPEEMRLRNWLFNNFREVSQLFGFEEVDYPVLEIEALYIRKAGEEIRDQLYCFEDRGNRRVALRPELTPSLARLVIQKGKSVPLPIKWFAVGQCWRYERMTRGRRREHYQWNMDIIGVPDVTGEAELISSIVTFFKRIGITAKDVGFKISSRKVLQEVLSLYSVPETSFAKACIIIDKMGKIPMEEIKKELMSVELSNEAIEDLLEVLSMKSLTQLEEKLGGAGEAVSELKQLFSLAEKFGYSEWIQFDASVVRGLAYYTGIVFEGFDREGKLRAICGGGRYDRLLSTFGGDDIPACGFGFGDAVIIELLKERQLLPEVPLEVENIVCSLGPDLQGAAATVATVLRGKGQCVDLVLENKPLKWVFKRAARINARRLILVGSSEWQRGMVSVKILSTGEQFEVNVDELDTKKKKRGQGQGQGATGGAKNSRGLRQFSLKVCEKVESKGRATYNEVADELVAEFSEPINGVQAPDQQQYDEKNIRRRVYDALNVLMAMDIISKDKKEIHWRGLPRTSFNNVEVLKRDQLALRNRFEKKSAYLQELQDQYVGLQNLIQRNEQLYRSGNAPSIEWLCLLYWCRLGLMPLWRWKFQRICSWSILTLIAPLLRYTMIIMFSRQ